MLAQRNELEHCEATELQRGRRAQHRAIEVGVLGEIRQREHGLSGGDEDGIEAFDIEALGSRKLDARLARHHPTTTALHTTPRRRACVRIAGGRLPVRTLQWQVAQQSWRRIADGANVEEEARAVELQLEARPGALHEPHH